MSDNNDPMLQVDRIATDIATSRNKPLLVMYYPNEHGMIVDLDVRDIYDEFRRRHWHTNQMVDGLDVLLHTYGGNPNAAYRIGQVIRDFAKRSIFLCLFTHTVVER